MWVSRQESTRPRGSTAVAVLLRLVLRIANILLALCGLAVIGYAVYMFGEVHRKGRPPGHAALPWFIVATASAGLFTFLTASVGLIGSARNSKAWLGLYSLMAVVLLLGQGLLVLAFFADAAWQRRLPHDQTGEAAALEHWIKKRMAVCQWVALGVLLLQVVSVLVAFALSSVQQRMLEGDSDDDDEVFGRRRPLLAQPAATSAAASSPVVLPPDPNDPWAQRMRDKYGLDVAEFRAAEEGTASAALPHGGPGTQQQAASQKCTIM